MREKVNIFWFRRDLRLDDNIGLYHSLRDDIPVVPIFIFDSTILEKIKDTSDKRVALLYSFVLDLKKQLNKIETDLMIIHDSPERAWSKICDQFDVQNVYFNEDYEPSAMRRDDQVQDLLGRKNINVSTYKDQCIFSKNDILKKDGTPYTVYTPYKNKWLETLTPKNIMSINCKKYFKNFKHSNFNPPPTLAELGFENMEVPLVKKYIRKKSILEYDKTRDIPALDATTRLGHHLRFGTISVRKCAQIGRELNQTWLSEIIWREFFMQIIFHFPHVIKGPFKEKYNRIKWLNKKSEFKKWCEGKTGYPLVDAGMRELNETGFMHNRVRMVTASFLIKDLLIDWRWGEKYFSEKLLDFDLSSNNGNWQWVAGTGCDSAPYFRIFNPDTQLKKFDPDFIYVKKWIPEYGSDLYPDKMIDHNFAYHRALLAYKA
jgi:deoxyribodipyrimidine photo-lyase